MSLNHGVVSYDAHPMAILSSAFSALGSFYEEANPSLRGQNLFTKSDPASLANMDKQIYRIIGKATTFAAYGLVDRYSGMPSN